MAALVKHVQGLDFSRTDIPALFLISGQDQVVSPEATLGVATRWGGKNALVNLTLSPGDDPYAHVIAGDIMSPGQTTTWPCTSMS